MMSLRISSGWGWACAILGAWACAAAAAGRGPELGTSAAIDGKGRLWIAYTEPQEDLATVMLRRSDDAGLSWQAPVRVTAAAEPVAADGENRPKLAFGPQGEIYLAWTSPTSAQHTGNIRFARSLDGGRQWSVPAVVHWDRQLITHRFESLLVDASGHLWIAWVDKRDRKSAEAIGRPYAGAAIYYAWSRDRGATWRGDFKVADGSCECCRIALAADEQGRPAVMWRHIFAPNERDHAFSILQPPRTAADPAQAGAGPARVTFDRWRIDACPHHGPSLAIDAGGTRHAVWFNQVKGEGRAFYGQLTNSRPRRVQPLPAGATHADVAVAGKTVAVAWKRYDGRKTVIESWVSRDGGQQFAAGPTLETTQQSDQPRLVSAGERLLLVWRRLEDVAVRDLSVPPAAGAFVGEVAPFSRGTLAAIENRHAGTPFWLVLWDLQCTYCMKSLRNLASAQRAMPDLRLVTVATDWIDAAPEIRARLANLQVRSEAYAFAQQPEEALRYAIDPKWLGEKPRAYRYAADGSRETVNGVIDVGVPAQR